LVREVARVTASGRGRRKKSRALLQANAARALSAVRSRRGFEAGKHAATARHSWSRYKHAESRGAYARTARRSRRETCYLPGERHCPFRAAALHGTGETNLVRTRREQSHRVR